MDDAEADALSETAASGFPAVRRQRLALARTLMPSATDADFG